MLRHDSCPQQIQMERRNLLLALAGAMSGGTFFGEALRPDVRNAPARSGGSGASVGPVGRSIESFGAAGDDVHDDTGAFMEAIAWERQTGGRQLVGLTPGKSYRVLRTLTFDFDGGGLVCEGGAAQVRFEMEEGNGIEVWNRREHGSHISSSCFRNVHLLNRSATAGHAWYYRRARFDHLNDGCGALGGWNHYFHYDNSCFGNNLLLRPHLEMGGRGRVGIWIGPVCNGIHVLHPEINNPAEVGVEIDATERSDIGEGPGVNSVVLDHVMTHNCRMAHLRLNGALGTSIRSPRLEASSSAAPLIVLGDRAGCANTVVETPWFQGSRTARTALDLHRSSGLLVTEPSFVNLAGAALRGSDATTGAVLIHPRVLGTTRGLFEDPPPRGMTVIGASGDITLLSDEAGLVLRDREDGRLYRVVSRGGRLSTQRV